MADLTNADLDRLDALALWATSGPWSVTPTRHDTFHVVAGLDGLGAVLADDLFSADDAAFIAAAREAVPALVAEVRELRVRPRVPLVERYGRSVLNCAASGCDGCMVCDPEAVVARLTDAAIPVAHAPVPVPHRRQGVRGAERSGDVGQAHVVQVAGTRPALVVILGGARGPVVDEARVRARHMGAEVI